jgi:sec-independent protein translocase protein TatA
MNFLPGPMELILVLVVVLIVFGAGRLTEIGGGLGKAIREFRSSVTDDDASNTPKDASNTTKKDE